MSMNYKLSKFEKSNWTNSAKIDYFQRTAISYKWNRKNVEKELNNNVKEGVRTQYWE